jgi:Holliday junction resolvase RusA-like endonuclease
MYKLNIKPLSLNNAYRGRRFSTRELLAFKQQVSFLAPKLEIPKGKLRVEYVFAVSSKASDGDNLIKCLQDALCEKYGVNDKMIYEWKVSKVDVKKGEEYIKFAIFEAV